MVKDPSIFSSQSIFLGLVSLKESRKSTCNYINFFLAVIDLKMVLQELFISPDLSDIKTLCIYELMKVIMVGKDDNLMLTVF